MTVEQVIKILTEWRWPEKTSPWSEKREAIKLGLEALKAIRDYRGPDGHSISIPSYLPGETEQ